MGVQFFIMNKLREQSATKYWLLLISTLLLVFQNCRAETGNSPSNTNGEIVFLSSLNLGEALQEFGAPPANQSSGGRKLQISGVRYTNGVGMHARSVLWIFGGLVFLSLTLWTKFASLYQSARPVLSQQFRASFTKVFGWGKKIRENIKKKKIVAAKIQEGRICEKGRV